MADQVCLRGGTTAERLAMTPAQKEVIVDNTAGTLAVGDGVTAGGIPLARADFGNVTPAIGRAALGLGTAAVLAVGTAAAAGVIPETNAAGALDASFLTASPGDYRNLLIGGNQDTNPWQMGTSIGIVYNNASYTAEQYIMSLTGALTAGSLTVSRVADAPTLSQQVAAAPNCVPVGCTYSLKVTMTTAAGGAGASTQALLTQPIEGFRWAALGYGAAGALSLTRSVWVKSSVVGTYSYAVGNAGATRSYVGNFTITAANTWQLVTLTIPGDTAGTWVGATNALAACVAIGLHVGSTYQGTAGAWQTGAYWGTSSISNAFIGTAGATFQIALDQLEPGSVATSFENLPVGQVLQLCQRYYYKSYRQGVAPSTAFTSGQGSILWGSGGSSTTQIATIKYPVTMRSQTPSLTCYDAGGNSGYVSYVASSIWANGGVAVFTSFDNGCAIATTTPGYSFNTEIVASARM